MVQHMWTLHATVRTFSIYTECVVLHIKHVQYNVILFLAILYTLVIILKIAFSICSDVHTNNLIILSHVATDMWLCILLSALIQLDLVCVCVCICNKT